MCENDFFSEHNSCTSLLYDGLPAQPLYSYSFGRLENSSSVSYGT
eukprot:COSAG06_NODE_811_length_12162_cov_78.059935_16_plen_45_part_00